MLENGLCMAVLSAYCCLGDFRPYLGTLLCSDVEGETRATKHGICCSLGEGNEAFHRQTMKKDCHHPA